MKTLYKSITQIRAIEIAKEKTRKLGGQGIEFKSYCAQGGMQITPVMIWKEVTENQEAAETIKPLLEQVEKCRPIYGLAEDTGLTLQQVAQGIKWLDRNDPYNFTADINRTGYVAGIHRVRNYHQEMTK